MADGRRRSRVRPPSEEERALLESAKAESTLQLLFRAARLADEEALRRVAALPGRPHLRRSHASLFPHLDLDHGTRITDLAERIGVTKQAISQLVDDLEAAGLVVREPDPEDARARRVRFTEKGRAGLFEGLAVLKSFEAELAAVVGERRMLDLRRTLTALLGHMDRGADPER